MLEKERDALGVWLEAKVPPSSAPYLALICIFLTFIVVAMFFDTKLAEDKYTEVAGKYNVIIICWAAQHAQLLVDFPLLENETIPEFNFNPYSPAQRNKEIRETYLREKCDGKLGLDELIIAQNREV